MSSVPTISSITPPLAVAIVLDTPYKPMLRGIRVGATAGGSVAVMNHRGDTITFTNVVQGETIHGQFQQVLSSDTTVDSPTTDLVGLQ